MLEGRGVGSSAGLVGVRLVRLELAGGLILGSRSWYQCVLKWSVGWSEFYWSAGALQQRSQCQETL